MMIAFDTPPRDASVLVNPHLVTFIDEMPGSGTTRIHFDYDNYVEVFGDIVSVRDRLRPMPPAFG